MKVFFTLSISIICLALHAQVNADRQSFGLSEDIEVLIMPSQDNELLKQAELRTRKKGRADCFAKSLKVNVDPHQKGTWDYTKEEIAIWRQKIISKDAKTLNLGFSRYEMPVGGRLFLIGDSENTVLGPFTKADNEDHGQLWTPVVEGDEIIIEIHIPVDQIKQLDIHLEHVNHDFMDILKSSGSEVSGSCNVDVVCGAGEGFPLIDAKRDIINSVGAFTLNGIEQCSGVLINNARNDCTPYFLTANHCEVSNSNAASVVVYWNYENSICRLPETVESGRDGDGSLAQFSTGSSFVAGYAPSDFTLLLLDDEVSAAFTPFFAGWNVGRVLPDSSICIHHPNVEEKRISFDYDPNVISIDAAEDTFVRVESWDLGTTERGSSGAPLFNNRDEVIGLLNSGQATCINNEFDDFGPMFLAWNGGGTPETRLKDWLDPDGLGLVSLSGKNCTFSLKLEEVVVEVCGEDTDSKQIDFSINDNFGEEVNISASDLPLGLVIDFDDSSLASGSSSRFTINNISGLAPDTYQIDIIANDGTNTAISGLVLKVFSSSGVSVSIIQPADRSVGELTNAFLSWSTESGEVDLELSTDVDFSEVLFDVSGFTGSSVTVSELSPGTDYFWRLRAKNICGVGEWSTASKFTTGQVFCSDDLENKETIIISDSISDTISSSINVDLNGVVRNVQITNIAGKHTWIGDLSMNLISPNGTTINLINYICDDADDFSLGFSDEQGVDDVPCPLTDGRLYQANGNLSSFEGEIAAGAWQLQIIDIATLDGGELEKWGIRICTEISSEAIIYIGNNEINICGESSTTSTVGIGLGFDGDVSLVVDAPDGVTAALAETTIDNGGATTLLISELEDTPSGRYQLTISATDGNTSISETIDLVVNRPLEELRLDRPTDEEVNTLITPRLEWERNGSEESYIVQLSTSSNFSSIVFDTVLTTNRLDIEEDVLDELTEYFWRVTVTNECNTVQSDIYSFTTEESTSTFQLQDLTFKVFPNPAVDVISLKTSVSLNRDINIGLYNIAGQLLMSGQMSVGARDFNLAVDHLASGLYFLNIGDGKIQYTEKIVIND